MLVIQHNCGCKYENTVMALETALNIEAGMVMLQEPFIGNRDICHSAFNFYWTQRERAGNKGYGGSKKRSDRQDCGRT